MDATQSHVAHQTSSMLPRSGRKRGRNISLCMHMVELAAVVLQLQTCMQQQQHRLSTMPPTVKPTCVIEVQRHIGFVAQVEKDGAAGLVELIACEVALLPVARLVPPAGVQACPAAVGRVQVPRQQARCEQQAAARALHSVSRTLEHRCHAAVPTPAHVKWSKRVSRHLSRQHGKHETMSAGPVRPQLPKRQEGRRRRQVGGDCS